MIWKWSLFLLSLVIAQGASDPLADINKEVTDKLKTFLENFTGHWQDNTEFLNWISRIRSVVNKNGTDLAEKFAIRFGFESYNIERSILELQISDRIEELDSIIPQQKNEKCLEFYVAQKTILKKALKQSNSKKLEKLSANSLSCPYYHYDYPEYLKVVDAIKMAQHAV
ncbi:uncharacterized protein LOC108049955 [Drosophila rhopaloa]|uniref:Uncharacterized protein LOC108049955 n=1 Tax=Drosophila rhopaloa TaxID=1041015 RepID=A0A6P4F8W0_DRORH|nr:uncharacterized protein LOC108049955 [Drosophila rhopaloa]